MVRLAFSTLPAALCVLVACAGCSSSPEIFRQEPAPTPQDIRERAPTTLDSDHPFEPPATRAEWDERARNLRRQVRVATGLWPSPPRTSLAASVHGRIERDDYSVEKVIFECLPGFHVTGNLYRPLAASTERRPGVLSPHGHWTDGRFSQRSEDEARAEIAAGGEEDLVAARHHLQARCVQLARMGCVVFHYDMIGYADSRQLDHASGFGDLEAELRAQNALGLQTWSSIRALDFLSALPDVDPERIGVTGASGGGTQTFMLCAVDPRPKVVFPAAMVSTRMQGGCVCENASHLRVGTGNVELAALCAPRPLALSGADDWTISIEDDALPPLRRVYELYGAGHNVDGVCYAEFEHNYNLLSRTQMYEWFAHHLGLDAETRERPFVPLTRAELSVFDAEHRLPDGAVDAAGLRRWLTGTAEDQLARLAPRNAIELAEYRRVVGGALSVLTHTTFPTAVDVTVVEDPELDRAGKRARVVLRRPTGEACAALLAGASNDRVVVLVSADPWDASLHRRVDAYVRRDAMVIVVAPFMTEEYERTFGRRDLVRTDVERHEQFVGYSWGYNKTLLAERVGDILTAIAYARADGDRSVRLVGVGRAGGWALLARALCGAAVERTACAQTWDFDRLEDLDDENFLPGALKYGGLAGFLGLCAPHPVRLVGAVPENAQDVYRVAGAREGLRSVTSLDELEVWLAGR